MTSTQHFAVVPMNPRRCHCLICNVELSSNAFAKFKHRESCKPDAPATSAPEPVRTSTSDLGAGLRFEPRMGGRCACRDCGVELSANAYARHLHRESCTGLAAAVAITTAQPVELPPYTVPADPKDAARQLLDALRDAESHRRWEDPRPGSVSARILVALDRKIAALSPIVGGAAGAYALLAPPALEFAPGGGIVRFGTQEWVPAGTMVPSLDIGELPAFLRRSRAA